MKKMTNNKYFVVCSIVDTWKFASNKLTERSSILKDESSILLYNNFRKRWIRLSS